VTPDAVSGSTGTFDFDAVTVSGVSRVYGRRRALHGVSFDASSGSIVGVLGPNGAGKSTLLGIVSTLLRPTSGSVAYGPAGPAEPAAVRARIGVLGHDLFLYPELTARENLTFFAGLYGCADVRDRVDDALARAGLSARADDATVGFSRGMRQRVALERALIHDPRLVLLDEPFTGLDEASAASLLARLRGLRDSGRIVVLATHDLDLADGLLDKALFCAMAACSSKWRGPPRTCRLSGRWADERAVWPLWGGSSKDLTVEVRSRGGHTTLLRGSVPAARSRSSATSNEGAGEGILWATLTFAGTLALGRTLNASARPRRSAPAPGTVLRTAVYVGKLVGVVGLLLAVQVVLVPLVTLFFGAHLLRHPLWLAGILVTGTIGFAAVGTLFAAMLVRARSRDVLLPVLLYPVIVPVLIAGVRGTSALVEPTFDVAIARFWLTLLLAFDAVFVTLALWTFEPLMSD
jgi:heme exporter protein A